MRVLQVFSIFFLLSYSALAQSLSISDAVSSVAFKTGKATTESATVLDIDGAEIVSGNYSTTDPDDPSLKVYPLQNGSFVVRENIANFILYDSFGRAVKPISNSTQSREGESISELAMDPNGKTIVIYNPKFVRDGKEGSRLRVIDVNNTPREIFYSSDQTIRAVKVSDSGEYIAIAVGKPGSDDEVVVLDKFGNQIQKVSFNQEIRGLNIYGSGNYLTVYSKSRAAVFNVLNGERIGSSSFRSSLLFANYSAADRSIIALTGNLEDKKASGLEVHVVNVGARKIARSSYDRGALALNDREFIRLERTGQYRYTITGLSKDLNVRASF